MDTFSPSDLKTILHSKRAKTFRRACIEALTQSEALDFMIDTLKAIALDIGKRTP